MQTQHAPSVPECPYPCGWKNLLTYAIKDGAYLARAISEGEPVTENARSVTMRMVMRLRDVLMALNNAAPEGWLRAIDEALVVAHIGVANESDTFEQAREKLDNLIGFHVDVASDPAVNGGWKLVPTDRSADNRRGAADAACAFDDIPTVAGLESAVSHLSACLDEFRALLVEVNDVCGRDGHGGPLEEGESEIIDKVRAALSMTEARPQEPKEICQ